MPDQGERINSSGVRTVPGNLPSKCSLSQVIIFETKGKCLRATAIIKASPRAVLSLRRSNSSLSPMSGKLFLRSGEGRSITKVYNKNIGINKD